MILCRCIVCYRVPSGHLSSMMYFTTFILDISILLHLKRITVYFRTLVERDFPGLTPDTKLTSLKIQLPIPNPRLDYAPDCWWELMPTTRHELDSVAYYYARRYHARPTLRQHWRQAIKFLKYNSSSNDILIPVPTHALLDMALFLGSSNLFESWVDRFIRYISMESIPYVFVAIARLGSTLPGCDEFGVHLSFRKAVARAKLVLRPYPEFCELTYTDIINLMTNPMGQSTTKFHHFGLQTFLNYVYTAHRVNDRVECLICHSNDLTLIATSMPCCQAAVHKTCRMAAVLPHNGYCYFCQQQPDLIDLLSEMDLVD